LHRLLGLDLISLAHKHKAGASLPCIRLLLPLKVDGPAVVAPLAQLSGFGSTMMATY